MSKSRKIWISVIALILVAAIVLIVVYATTGLPEKSYNEFLTDIDNGQVTEVYIANDTANVKIRGTQGNRYSYYVYVRNDSGLDTTNISAYIVAYNANNPNAQIKLTYNNRYAVDPMSYIVPIVMLIFLIVLAVLMFRAMKGSGGSTMNFGKTRANAQGQTKVRFSDVAGAEEEKTELVEIVEFLKNPQKFTTVGARIPHGVLLVGPPGTGKTLFAKAVAGEANVPFFSISGSDFVEMFVGVGASRVRDLFDQAKKNTPCIVFIDEIDAVGRQRGAGLGGGNDEREQTLNQLLVQMDGFDTNSGIIVMAATNRSDILDPALMRPGRFDRQVYVHTPDVRGREAIFKVHSRNKPMASDIDFQILARITSGFSGADIENMINEAAIFCARDNRTKITMEDCYEAIDKVVMGPQKKSRLVTEVDKRITAYHESGHAIVAKCIKECDPVQEITIIPRGNAAGYTMTRPDNDDNHMTISKLKGILAMTMGGRSAEELFIQDITSGACGDIQQATGLARKMVAEWGMSKQIGPVYYGGSQEVFLGRDYTSQHTYSEDVASKIDKEVSGILEDAHQRALEILRDRTDVMERMVRVLIECETIYAEEVDMLMDGASVDEIKASLERRKKGRDKHRRDMESKPTINVPVKDGAHEFKENAAVKKEEGEKKSQSKPEAKPVETEKPSDDKKDEK